ncbi:hypothetical protein XPA_002097 [Xanthoria parietina]
MGQPSYAASNALIYLTYGAFLVTGVWIAWLWRGQSKKDFLANNRTQKAIPLALNFIASGECSGSVHDTRTSGSNPYDASHTCAYTALARPVR